MEAPDRKLAETKGWCSNLMISHFLKIWMVAVSCQSYKKLYLSKITKILVLTSSRASNIREKGSLEAAEDQALDIWGLTCRMAERAKTFITTKHLCLSHAETKGAINICMGLQANLTITMLTFLSRMVWAGLIYKVNLIIETTTWWIIA